MSDVKTPGLHKFWARHDGWYARELATVQAELARVQAQIQKANPNARADSLTTGDLARDAGKRQLFAAARRVLEASSISQRGVLKSFGASTYSFTGKDQSRNQKFMEIFPSPDFYKQLSNMMADAAPKLIAAIDRYLPDLAIDVFDKWPVDTGLSKTLIGLEYKGAADGQTIIATLAMRAPYTLYIKGNPAGEARRGIDNVVRWIIAEAGDTLAEL